MMALLAPFSLLVGAHPLRLKRHVGACPLELLLALALAVLFGLPYQFFAGVLLGLAPRCPIRRALLSRLFGRPLPFDALDISFVHQQPASEAVRRSDTETTHHTGRQSRKRRHVDTPQLPAGAFHGVHEPWCRRLTETIRPHERGQESAPAFCMCRITANRRSELRHVRGQIV